jgi:type IV pilus assembly protein PilW
VTAGNVLRASFPAVIAVKVCLVIRSSEAVLDMELYPDPLKPPKYLNCDLSEVTITDMFLRRAYFTTVTLRNRMAF